MFEPRQHETLFLHALRLVARAASIICLALIILFFVVEGFNLQAVSARELAGFLFFPIGVFIGLVLAWHEEGLGGAIVVASVLAFYLIYGWLLNGNLRQGWTILPFLAPGILFLLYRFAATPQISLNGEKVNR